MDFGRQSDNFGRVFDNFGRIFGNFATDHNYSPSGRQVPVHRPAAPSPSPKVVNVPVQFFRSKYNRSSSAAVKIQKAFRGFWVRKSVRKIAAVKSEVDDIERRISRKETLELMRREAKERLKVNEMLMSLLLRLDSVKGFDSGVREFRSSVVKKAIALQERVDAAVVATAADGDDETLEEVDEDNWESISETIDGIGAVEIKDPVYGEKPQIDETLELQSGVGDHNVCGSIDQDGGFEEYVMVKQQEEDDDGCAMEIAKSEHEENKRSRELLEKMVEDNQKMMGMMMQLFERNEVQTRMLSSLTNRVDQLERAIACERMRRRKKRHAAAAGDFLVWKSPDNRARRL